MNGWLAVDKPSGMTSREVVNAVQNWFPRRTKVGHTGTLDPRATGLLVICIGEATKLADTVQSMGKRYWSRIRLGATSDTDDADGAIVETASATPPDEAAVRAAIPAFIGSILQLPPIYSALKVGGKRAHKLARRGIDPKLEPRTVRVDAIRFLSYDWPYLELEIDCGKGTYVRSIARDLGAIFGVGGLVQELRRTRVGPFVVEEAIPLESSRHAAVAALQPLERSSLYIERGDSIRFVSPTRQF